MDKDGYQRGSHTVTDLKYHFVWRTKYSYGVLQGEMAMRIRDIIREICAEKGLMVVKGNFRHCRNDIGGDTFGAEDIFVPLLVQSLKTRSKST